MKKLTDNFMKQQQNKKPLDKTYIILYSISAGSTISIFKSTKMENKNLKNNQVINESLFLSAHNQSEPKKITLQEFIKKHRSSKTYKEEITFNWVHLASTENTYWEMLN